MESPRSHKKIKYFTSVTDWSHKTNWSPNNVKCSEITIFAFGNNTIWLDTEIVKNVKRRISVIISRLKEQRDRRLRSRLFLSTTYYRVPVRSLKKSRKVETN